MRMLFFSLAGSFLGLLAFENAYAHMYDSVGIEAAPHEHEVEQSDLEIKDNCFVDPKLGPVCK